MNIIFCYINFLFSIFLDEASAATGTDEKKSSSKSKKKAAAEKKAKGGVDAKTVRYHIYELSYKKKEIQIYFLFIS